jgi:hypothetical protein
MLLVGKAEGLRLMIGEIHLNSTRERYRSRTGAAVCLALVLGVAAVFAAPSSAFSQEIAPELRLEPASGAVGTVVTIDGSGAPPHASVLVLWLPWPAGYPCEPPPMGAFLVDEVVADAEGNFSATHHTDIEPALPDAEFQGVTYFAKAFEHQSEFVCFSFADPAPTVLASFDGDSDGPRFARHEFGRISIARPTRHDALLGI